jgi:hypothetical protein
VIWRLAIFAFLLGGCATVQRAAEKDPQRCERDPNCNAKRSRAADCTTQCADDRACMERCEQVNGHR